MKRRYFLTVIVGLMILLLGSPSLAWINMQADPGVIHEGNSSVLSGQVFCCYSGFSGGPIPNATVEIAEMRWDSEASAYLHAKTIANVTTDSQGNFSYTFEPNTTRVYMAKTDYWGLGWNALPFIGDYFAGRESFSGIVTVGVYSTPPNCSCCRCFMY